MKLNIAQKLLLMMLLITALVVSLSAILTRMSIVEGFTSYVAKNELRKTSELAPSLEHEYAQKGSWDFIKKNPNIVWQLILQNEFRHRPPPPFSQVQPSSNWQRNNQLLDGRPPMNGPQNNAQRPVQNQQAPSAHHESAEPIDFDGPPPERTSDQNGGTSADKFQSDEEATLQALQGLNGRQLLPPHRMVIFQQVGIFTPDGKLLWGNNNAAASKESIPLHYNNQLIGQLKMVQTQRLSSEIDREFVNDQNQNLLFICLADFALAAVCAYAFSKHFVAAIKILVDGTRKLTAGDFATRIKLSRSDELGELAQDFNSLAQSLEKHDLEHKQWITDTSHELRTPIAILRAQVEALQDGVHEVSPKTLSALHSQIMAMSKFVYDLHDLAKSDAGALSYHFVPVNVWSVLQEAVDAFEDRFRSQNIIVSMQKPDNVHCVVKADGDRLQQLFSNLLENTLRYTNEGGKLLIAAKEDGAYLTLLFDDSEPGLTDDILPRIFDRFFRAESSRSRVFGGTGLGLAICKTIVEAHGGTIMAYHSSLGGVRMEVKLQLLKDTANA